jgi:hypothetical protein
MLTDKFTDSVAVDSIMTSGNSAVVRTPRPHELTSGTFVTVVGVKTKVQVVSLYRVGPCVTGVTAESHDLTQGYSCVEVEGATPAEFNGTFAVTATPNRHTFEYRLTDVPAENSASGTISILEDRLIEGGLNGRKQISVLDEFTFSYPINSALILPIAPGGEVRVAPRVSGSVELQSAINSYTKQPRDKYWAYVVLNDVFISKDRSIDRDSVTTFAPGDAYRQSEIIPFEIFVFAPTTQELSARATRDIMQSEISRALYKSLLNVRLPSRLGEPQYAAIVANGHGTAGYTEAYYIHRFSFETSSDITYQDTFGEDFNAAIQSIELDFLKVNECDDTIIMSANVDLTDR